MDLEKLLDLNIDIVDRNSNISGMTNLASTMTGGSGPDPCDIPATYIYCNATGSTSICTNRCSQTGNRFKPCAVPAKVNPV